MPRHLHTFWHPGLRRVFLPTTDDLLARFQNLENRHRESQAEIERCRVACASMQAERDRALRDRTQYMDAYMGATVQFRRGRGRVARRVQAGQPEERDETDEAAERQRQGIGRFALERLGAFLGFGESHQHIDERTLELQVALGREQRLQDQLEELSIQMATKDLELAAKTNELTAKDLELVAKTNELTAKDEQLAVQNGQLAVRNDQIAEKDRELVNKDTELVAQNREIERMAGQLQTKDNQLRDKEAEAASSRRRFVRAREVLLKAEDSAQSLVAKVNGLREEIHELKNNVRHLRGQFSGRRSALNSNARSTAQASNMQPHHSESNRGREAEPLSPPSGRSGELLETPARIPPRAGTLPRGYVASNRRPTAPVATIVDRAMQTLQGIIGGVQVGRRMAASETTPAQIVDVSLRNTRVVAPSTIGSQTESLQVE
ncbi:hypothetical protein EIP86_009991 [Pleurotus ostreatoroseus]|nr:hypothetical protein EIP86_009991 [Pleurotus ostreatoroseus]